MRYPDARAAFTYGDYTFIVGNGPGYIMGDVGMDPYIAYYNPYRTYAYTLYRLTVRGVI